MLRDKLGHNDSNGQVQGHVYKLVDNAYLKHGNLWYQTYGTKCAGCIANLNCFTYEIEFLRRMVDLRRF